MLIGVMAATVLLWLCLWAAWGGQALGAAFWVPVVIAAVVAVAAVVASLGCFVVVDPAAATVRDVVAWRTRRVIDQPRIVAARVRAGPWRWFDLELDDGTHVVLLGASPTQFPARLLPESRERDLADIDVLMGPDEPASPAGGGRVAS